jgi:hypothetical protein
LETAQETDQNYAGPQWLILESKPQLKITIVKNVNIAFIASTGRTATQYIASTLNRLGSVTGLHEGQLLSTPPQKVLPSINVQNRRAWYDQNYASKTVEETRNELILTCASKQSNLIVDTAYYNASILEALINKHPRATFFVVFRRCETFVRSATILRGEDHQPAGWPDPGKPLSDRELFISIGRLKPDLSSKEASKWQSWSAIQRNIWLWSYINSQLYRIHETYKSCHKLYFEEISTDTRKFWRKLLGALSLDEEENLNICLANSHQRINPRSTYQIGSMNTWDEGEIKLYKELAHPLEIKLYG